MRVQEGAQEGVEVVGGGGEVEPGWGEEGVDVGVEGGHAGYGGGGGDEGGAEDADGGGGHGDFDGVVDVLRGELVGILRGGGEGYRRLPSSLRGRRSGLSLGRKERFGAGWPQE